MEQLPGCEIVKYNIQADHIHMVMVIPPKYSVSTVVGKIKGMTSSELRKKFKWLKNRYWKENIVWSPGYFVSTVGKRAFLGKGLLVLVLAVVKDVLEADVCFLH